MKSVKLKDFLSKLSQLGVVYDRSGKGSHRIYRLGDRIAVIPQHREVSPGTQRDILKLLGLNKQSLNF